MNHQIVTFDENLNPIFPQDFPKKRGNNDQIDHLIMGLVFLAVSYYYTSQSKQNLYIFVPNLITAVAYNYLFLVFLEILSKMCCLREEFRHLYSRYDNSILCLLQKLYFKKNTRFLITTSTLILPVLYTTFIQGNTIVALINSVEIIPWLLSLIGVKFLSTILRLDENDVNTSKIIERSHIDYGSSMAVNYFYGYLSHMLPKTEDPENKNLQEKIEDYISANENVVFASKKLHILLPLSAECPPNLEDYSPNEILEYGKNLKSKRRHRAGIKFRNYHNTVYKLWPNGLKTKPLYMCVEFASPLQTLHEVTTKSNHAFRELYNEHKKQIVMNFFWTVLTLIKENNFNDFCELILFKDKDENGRLLYKNRLDIGDLLLSKLNITRN